MTDNPLAASRRIAALDGLRAVAIMWVMLYHFYVRWTPPIHPISYYPFGSMFSDAWLLRYGYYGVFLFFCISGFVITMTLMRSRSLVEFCVYRFARLWPSMLLCAVLTFVFIRFFPQYFAVGIEDFLPSLTLIDGTFYNALFSSNRFGWMDGAYWSLFVEVQFYGLIAIVYFLSRQHFYRNFFVVSLCVVVATFMLRLLTEIRIAQGLLPAHLPWFLFGLGAYSFVAGSRAWAYRFVALAMAALLSMLMSESDMDKYWASLCVLLLFAASFFVPWVQRLLSLRVLVAIGVASYSTYLLHQSIGVTLGAVLSQRVELHYPFTVVLPLGIIAVLLVVSRVIFIHYEVPMNRWIRRVLCRKKLEP